MNDALNFVKNSKKNLEDIVEKKLIYNPQLEEKVGLTDLIPKDYRKLFVIIFTTAHENIEKPFFMFNEQYKVTISYLKEKHCPQNWMLIKYAKL